MDANLELMLWRKYGWRVQEMSVTILPMRPQDSTIILLLRRNHATRFQGLLIRLGEWIACQGRRAVARVRRVFGKEEDGSKCESQ